jgi:hypothetical protein
MSTNLTQPPSTVGSDDDPESGTPSIELRACLPNNGSQIFIYNSTRCDTPATCNLQPNGTILQSNQT